MAWEINGSSVYRDSLTIDVNLIKVAPLGSKKDVMNMTVPSRKKVALFVLSVDTEEEWDWAGPFPQQKFSVKNTVNIPKFQGFCDRLGIKPTYFVDYAIADDPESVARLKEPMEKGNCEIGGHLHPWCNPPVDEDVSNVDNSHAINLPVELVEKKLENLNRKLEGEFGEKPRSFRSGRWGTNGAMLRLLADKGYTIDSSIHPYYADGPFSYHDAPDVPFWPSYECCTELGDQREIYEVPVTAGYNKSNFSFWNRLHLTLSKRPLNRLRLVGVLWKLGVMRKIQLSPELADAESMISLVKAALAGGHQVIHMYFHSSSLLPGMTPYIKNEADEKAFYGNIEAVLEYLKEHTDVHCCTLEEAAKRIVKEGS